MYCTFVVHCEANNERWIPASYWEGTAGSFYFRLPSGKESTHLPGVKTQPSHLYSLCLCWKNKRPHDKIYNVGSSAVEICMPTGGEAIHSPLKTLSNNFCQNYSDDKITIRQTGNPRMLDEQNFGNICCCQQWKLLWPDVFELIIEVWLFPFSGRKF